MTGREWRTVTECFMADLRAVLDYDPEPMSGEGYPDPTMRMFVIAEDKRLTAEAKLRAIQSRMDAFYEKHLNRETCDDFDE